LTETHWKISVSGGSLEFGGAISVFLRKRDPKFESDDYEELLFKRIRDRRMLKEVKGADYIFDGGIVYRFLPAEHQNGYMSITIGFRQASDVLFINSLLDAATTESPLCGLRISARGAIDFDGIKENAKRKYREGFSETRENNFSFSIKMAGHEVKVTAYPSTRILSIEGTYNRFTMKPSLLLSEAMGMGGKTFIDRLKTLLHFR